MADQKAVPATENAAPSVEGPGPRLTPAQREKIGKWLDGHWTNYDCPFHGTTTWEVGDLLHGARAFHPIGVPPLNKSYVNVVLICNVCGYSVLINAIKMGIVEPDPAAGE